MILQNSKCRVFMNKNVLLTGGIRGENVYGEFAKKINI